MPFVGWVYLEPVREAGWFDRGLWRVVSPLVYRSVGNSPPIVIGIPEGFETDLSSVPRWLPFGFALAGGTAVKAGLVHDYVYKHEVYVGQNRRMLTREECDLIFWEIMKLDKVPAWRRSLMWAGVRLGGRRFYGPEGESDLKA